MKKVFRSRFFCTFALYLKYGKMKRAIISVSNKEGVVPFAQELTKLGFEIISTGGTRKALEAAGVPTIGISEVTGFP